MTRAQAKREARESWASYYDEIGEDERRQALGDCRSVTDAIWPGLDLSGEITSIDCEGFGETVLLDRDGRIAAFACCHHGAGSEAGSAQAPQQAQDFRRLLDACAGLAARRGVTRLVAGTNTGRSECYHAMQEAGFRTWMNGIAMLRPEADGYNRTGVHVIDDWR